MFSWRRKAPRERRRRKRLGGSGGMLPQEIFKIEYSETPFPAFLEPRKQFPRQCWRSLKFSLKSKLLNDALVRKIYNTVVKKNRQYWSQSTGRGMANDRTKRPASDLK